MLVFMLEDKTFALPLENVDRVVRVVEFTRLPQAPSIVLGVINYKGTVLPVIDIRGRFHLPQRAPRLEDQLVIAHTAQKTIALLAENVVGDIETPLSQLVPPGQIVEGTAFLKAVLKLEDGVMLIPDLDKILTSGESLELEKAIEKQKTPKKKKSKTGKV